jgi:hypothetical protein
VICSVGCRGLYLAIRANRSRFGSSKVTLDAPTLEKVAKQLASLFLAAASKLHTRQNENSGATREPYEDMIPPYGNHGNQKCPLVVVPADKKWFTRAVVAAATVDAMWSLDLHFPKMDAAQRTDDWDICIRRQRRPGAEMRRLMAVIQSVPKTARRTP